MRLKTVISLISCLLATLALTACQLPVAPVPAATTAPAAVTTAPAASPSASVTPEPTATPAPTNTPAPCEIAVPAGVNVYTRPSLEADLFYTTSAEEQFPPGLARTADGWIGFDPGVAQAPNVGPFRLRWLQEEDASLQGDCESLPVVEAPPPGVCFDMISAPTDVHSGPDASTSVLITLDYGDWAEMLGVTPDQSWAKISLLRGSPAMDIQGWVDIATINVNGPCFSLPTVQP